MGNFMSRKTTVETITTNKLIVESADHEEVVQETSATQVLVPVGNRTILINQASCYGCNSVVVNEGTCKCGNVQVYGKLEELGRRVKNKTLYGDSSLVEYKGML
jgi:hypothetical protein